MQLGKMKVTRREGGAITVQEFLDDEEGCFVSTPGSDRIEGRYLYELASAVADAQPKVTALMRAAAGFLLALKEGSGSHVEARLKSLQQALAACGKVES